MRKAQDTDGLCPASLSAPSPYQGVAALPWNYWQLSCGISGKLRLESVAVFVWNAWQVCPGISGSFGVEYAPSSPHRNFNYLCGRGRLQLHHTAIRCISIHHVSTPSISDPRRALAILQGYHLTPKLHATIRVTVFLLDSLFPAGYGYEREQARGGLLMKPCRYLCKLKAKLALSAR